MAKNKGKLKSPAIFQGKQISVSASVSQHPFNIDHPIFCLRYLHKDYNLDGCSADEKIAFLTQIVKLSQLSWDQINITGRHGMGREQIAIKSLKTTIPMSFTKDVEHVDAFRFLGYAPFLGHRNRFVFHVLFIDPKMTTYKH